MSKNARQPVKDDLIQLRVTKEFKAGLEQLAGSNGMRLTEYINFLLRTELEKARGLK